MSAALLPKAEETAAEDVRNALQMLALGEPESATEMLRSALAKMEGPTAAFTVGQEISDEYGWRIVIEVSRDEVWVMDKHGAERVEWSAK